MPKYTSPLDNVRVAAPCPADWDRMVGDERARYCDRCSLHVYNLSGMTRRAAEALITNAEGRLCVRYYARPDGTIITQNCPTGLRAIRQRVTRTAGAVLSALLGFFSGVGLNSGLGRTQAGPVHGKLAQPPVTARPADPPKSPREGELFEVTGDISIGNVRDSDNIMMGLVLTDEENLKRRYLVDGGQAGKRGK